jgi:hypothetical protein
MEKTLTVHSYLMSFLVNLDKIDRDFLFDLSLSAVSSTVSPDAALASSYVSDFDPQEICDQPSYLLILPGMTKHSQIADIRNCKV